MVPDIYTIHAALGLSLFILVPVLHATQYLSNLLEGSADIVALCEHWLWPFELSDLNNLHPNYTSFGQADNRLNEHSLLNRGCGGVGIIWKKCLPICPTSIDSDRICGVQIIFSNCTLSIALFT